MHNHGRFHGCAVDVAERENVQDCHERLQFTSDALKSPRGFKIYKGNRCGAGSRALQVEGECGEGVKQGIFGTCEQSSNIAICLPAETHICGRGTGLAQWKS